MSDTQESKDVDVRQAVVALRNAEIEQDRRERELSYILAGAQCLLWYADVQYVREKDRIRWFLWPPDEEAARRFLPFPIAEGQSFGEAFYACRLDEDKARTDAYGYEEVRAGRSYKQEYRCRLADGEMRWLSETVQLEPVGEDRWRAVIVCTDVTEIKRREEEIAALNARLQRAMTETHHRVKNNLQIIAAMIDMQTMDAPETLPLAEFIRLGQHVRTLAAVHDILTQEAKEEGQTESVSAKAILDKLLPMIAQTSGDRRIRYTLQDARLTGRQGTSLALITNELVSNAFKHGQGELEVTFAVQGAVAALEVCDDGPGFPAGFDPIQAANTGLELVNNLTRWDLRGTTSFGNRAGGRGGKVIVAFAPAAEPPVPEEPTPEM